MAGRMKRPAEATPAPQATSAVTGDGLLLPEDQVGLRVTFKEPFYVQGKRRKGPNRPIQNSDSNPERFVE